jgi:hypothetical protein
MGTGRYPSSDALMAEASKATGLEDFGPGDFREGLDVLLESLETDADLSPSTDVAVIADFRRRLVNRLQVEAWYGEHPEIAELPVRGPVDINGLPRTGTSALGNILSLDPQFRAHIDSDGKFRAVISRLDPGVPNWLDKADYPWGVIQMRWNLASVYPNPTIKKVPVADVRQHVPSDTPIVTPAERHEQLRIRRESAQLRRIW